MGGHRRGAEKYGVIIMWHHSSERQLTRSIPMAESKSSLGFLALILMLGRGRLVSPPKGGKATEQSEGGDTSADNTERLSEGNPDDNILLYWLLDCSTT